MAKNIIKYLYSSLPDSLKSAIGMIPFSLRMGPRYRETVRYLLASQFLRSEESELLQFEKLRHVLTNAYRCVPYYRRLFDCHGFAPGAMKGPRDIELLPLLSKEDVFRNHSELVSVEHGTMNSYSGMTGGTTGKPLHLIFDMATPFVEWAFIHSLWMRAGFEPSHTRVSMTGIPFRNNKRTDVRYEPFHRELQLSISRLDEERLARYAALIQKFRPDFIYGYPSCITLLAEYLECKGFEVCGAKGVLCGSENFTNRQVALMERVFGCRMYTWYGMTEKTVLGGECEYSRDYHLVPEYGYTEIVDEQGRVIREAGKCGEIIGTSFINPAMPLVRYRTGDYGEYADPGDCPCGRPHRRIKRIAGRRNGDFLFDASMSKVPLMAIDTQQEEFRNVHLMQFVQETAGRVTLNIARNARITEDDLHGIRTSLKGQLNGRMSIDVRLVKDLSRTETGKIKACIQRINNGNKG